MKRISLMMFASILFLSAIVGFDLYGASKSFSGRVIYLEEGKFMVKVGPAESEFVYDSSLEIIPAYQGSDKSDAAESPKIEICQYVRVAYTREGKTLKATRVEILKESDCYK
jgi:hypothetical protein